MEQFQYQELLKDFAGLADLAEPDKFVETGLVNVGDMNMLLYYNHEINPERLQVRVDLGEAPENKFAEVMIVLMNANYVLGNGGAFVFSLLPGTTRVVLTAQQDIDTQTTAQDLWQALSEIARRGRDVWEGGQS